jgi:hypothetical protein
MLLHYAGTTLAVAPRTPGNGFDENVHLASGGYTEKPEAQQAAELPHARVVLPAPPAAGGAYGKPDLIAGGGAVHRLKDKLQREGELQLSDDNGRGLAVTHSDEIAPADLTLHLEAEPFEEALDGKVEARFQDWDPSHAKPLMVIRRVVEERYPSKGVRCDSFPSVRGTAYRRVPAT